MLEQIKLIGLLLFIFHSKLDRPFATTARAYATNSIEKLSIEPTEVRIMLYTKQLCTVKWHWKFDSKLWIWTFTAKVSDQT